MSLQFLSELNNIFHVKGLKNIYFSGQINLTIGERPNKKNIELLNLTRKVNILTLWRGNVFFLAQISLVIYYLKIRILTLGLKISNIRISNHRYVLHEFTKPNIHFSTTFFKNFKNSYFCAWIILFRLYCSFKVFYAFFFSLYIKSLKFQAVFEIFRVAIFFRASKLQRYIWNRTYCQFCAAFISNNVP